MLSVTANLVFVLILVVLVPIISFKNSSLFKKNTISRFQVYLSSLFSQWVLGLTTVCVASLRYEKFSMIGLQNLPEAFNSFRDMVLSGYGVKKTLVIFSFLSFSGIIGALIGHYFLSNYPDFTAYLMVFASGGILYLIFQDIAPASKMKESFIPSLGATGGFLVGMIGEKVI